jgi:DNA repair ATPase RecN
MTSPTMVFDEVDVGIGGAVAEVVARLLADMATHAQVLCVTHLPQVAAQGGRHLLVEKHGRASARVDDCGSSTTRSASRKSRACSVA